MGQIHQWEIAVSDIASAFLNTSVNPSRPLIFAQAPRELQYSEPMAWRLKRQLHGLRDASKSWQAHFLDHDQQGNESDEVRLLYLPQEDHPGHVQLAVMAYVDDLVIAGDAQMVKEFVSVIQEAHTQTCQLPHFRESGRVLKQNHQASQKSEHHDTVSQTLIDELLKTFEVTGKVTTTGLKLQAVSEDQNAQCDKVISARSVSLSRRARYYRSENFP